MTNCNIAKRKLLILFFIMAIVLRGEWAMGNKCETLKDKREMNYATFHVPLYAQGMPCAYNIHVSLLTPHYSSHLHLFKIVLIAFISTGSTSGATFDARSLTSYPPFL